MVNRAFLAMGTNPELVRLQNKTDVDRPMTFDHFKTLVKKKSKRTGGFALPPFMVILANYLHEKDTLRRTLLNLDTELVLQADQKKAEQGASGTFDPGNKRRTVKSFIDIGLVAFLQELETGLQNLEPYFALDTIGLSRICRALFLKMDSRELQRMRMG